MNLTNSTRQTTPNKEENLIVFCLLLAFSFSAIILNQLVIFILAFRLSLRSYSNLLLFTYSVSNLLEGLLQIPFDAYYSFYSKSNFLFSITFIKLFGNSVPCLGFHNLLLLTIHRYKQIIDPFNQKDNLSRPRVLFLGLVFSLNFFIWFFISFQLNGFKFDKNFIYLKFTFAHSIILDFIFYLVPFILMATLTFLILKSIFLIKSPNRKSIKNKQLKAVKCVLVIFFNVFISWILFIISWPIDVYYGSNETIFYQVSYWLSYLPVSTDPIILLLFNTNLNKELKSC